MGRPPFDEARKRAQPFNLALPGDLREYLQEKADANFRSLTGEVAMRLEQSRKADLQGEQQGAAQ